MTRVQTTYYGAEPTTQFQWATVGTDQFSRERDLYYLSQALEYHDHTSTRGLPVGRVADGSLTPAAYAAQSVGTTALANLGVTTEKINDGAVTRPKLQSPLIQSSNDYLGGIRIANISGVNTAHWFVDTTGITYFGVGAGYNQIAIHPVGGKLSLGGAGFPVSGNVGMVNIYQTGATNADGVRWCYPGNDGLYMYQFIGPSGEFVWQGNGIHIIGVANYFYPAAPNVYVLGHPSSYWGHLYVMNANVSGALSAVGLISSGSLGTGPLACTSVTCTSINAGTGAINCGALTCTSLSISGGGLGAISCTTITASGHVTAPSLGTGGITCSTITASGAISCPSLTTGPISAGVITCSTVNPSGGDNTGSIGQPGSRWSGGYFFGVFDNDGALGVASDEKVKVQSSFRLLPYGLKELVLLKPQRFRYRESFGAGSKERWGFKAQDVQPIFPEIVETVDWPNEQGEMEPTLMMKPGLLLYVAINAIKELADRLEKLEERRN